MSIWPTDPELFRALVEGSPNGILMMDRDGTVLAVNPAVEKLSEYRAEELVGQRMADFASEQTAAFVRDALKAAERRDILVREIAMRTKSGTPKALKVSAIPIHDGGSNEAVIIVGVDISERRAVEDRLQMFVDQNPAVVFAVDRAARITFVNPEGLRLSGYTESQVLGHSLRDFIPEQSIDRVMAAYRQALRGEPAHVQLLTYAADGRIMQYDGSMIPSRNTKAEIVGAYGILQNITDYEEAQRQLHQRDATLENLERDFDLLFADNPNGVLAVAVDGTIVDLNAAVLALGGRRREDVVGKNFRDFLQASNAQKDIAAFERAVRGEAVTIATSFYRPDGAEVDAEIALLPKYSDGVVAGVYGIVQDVTERNRLQRSEAVRAERLRELYAIATTSDNPDVQVHVALQTGCRLLSAEHGIIVADGMGLHVDAAYPETVTYDQATVLEYARAIMSEREAVSGECWIGSRLVVGSEVYGTLLFTCDAQREREFDANDRDFVAWLSALLSSALERRRTRSHLRTLAYYDSLTGLPNRLLFQERLRDAILDVTGQQSHIAVLLFDLDRFKDMNDYLGHAMGDRMLQMVAHRLDDVVRDRGLVARMGGDEFIVMLTGFSSASEIAETAQTMLDAIDEPYRIEDSEQFMSASVGIAVFPSDGRDDQTLIKNADLAMYRAKDHGRRGYFFYNQNIETPLLERLSQEKLLRRALDQNEFLLHYQPIYDLRTDSIVGVEALLRWHHPQRGLIFPDHFIPSAEASGLIVQLGDWVLNTGLEELRRWHDAGHALHLAVNTSARQFFLPDLGDRVRATLERLQIPAPHLHLEITESMAMSDAAHAIETVRHLKEYGVCISVDDFGTGHSSLSYLRRFAVDHLKIDRSFVHGIGHEENDETIVNTLIAMGHSLGLIVVAEGVETAAQVAFLREHGCDRIQGFYISPAVEPSAIAPLAAKYRGTSAQPG